MALLVDNTPGGSRRYRALDEVDRMLAMGFVEDVELILKTEEARKV